MHALAFVALISASTLGECRSDDCGRCYKAHSHSVCRDWESYWCNLAKPCDFRLQCIPWPLEYPGARGIGWMSQGVAANRDTPINVGPHAVQVVMGEDGIPIALRKSLRASSQWYAAGYSCRTKSKLRHQSPSHRRRLSIAISLCPIVWGVAFWRRLGVK